MLLRHARETVSYGFTGIVQRWELAPGLPVDERAGCEVRRSGMLVVDASLVYRGGCRHGYAQGPGELWVLGPDGAPIGYWVGTWRDGSLAGLAASVGANGGVTFGKMSDNRLSSPDLTYAANRGFLVFPNGSTYLGFFSEGQFSGNGALTAGGVVLTGEWQGGACVNACTISLGAAQTELERGWSDTSAALHLEATPEGPLMCDDEGRCNAPQPASPSP